MSDMCSCAECGSRFEVPVIAKCPKCGSRQVRRVECPLCGKHGDETMQAHVVEAKTAAATNQ